MAEKVKKFLKPLSFYEKICRLFEPIPLRPWKSLEEKYREAIEFSHLQVTPNGVFSLAILLPLAILLVLLPVIFFLGLLEVATLIFLLTLVSILAYFLYNYPFYYATLFRIKASTEMALLVVYLAISMRTTRNLENAVVYAAKNLKGPLAYDLNEILWEIYTGKLYSIEEGIEKFAKKWKRESEEFTEAITLIKTSLLESPEKMEKSLDEAISVMLNGTRNRMRSYARDLAKPVTVTYSMGILLPLIGILFLVIIGVVFPQIKPIYIAFGYDIFLPLVVYTMMREALEKRPYTFHQPDISKHPKFVEEKLFGKTFFISFIIALSAIIFFGYQILLIKEPFSFSLLLYSLLMLFGVASGIIIYCIFTTRNKLKLRSEIVQIESEFTEVLLKLGNLLSMGLPLEASLRSLTPKIKNLRIAGFFKTILYNIETYGMTLERAVFDKKYGAMRYYPSTLIEIIMRAIVEVSKRGRAVMAKTMTTIASYLKDMEETETYMKEILAEPISSMQLMSQLLAPLTAGMVVALTSAMMRLLVEFAPFLKKIETSIAGGFAGPAGATIFTSLLNIDKMIPAHLFQFIVGIYFIETIIMLTSFTSTIQNGEENLLKRFMIGKSLLFSMLIYLILAIGIFLIFDSLIPRLLPMVGVE